MKVKIKKLSDDAVIPQYAKPGDAGMDLTAVNFEHDIENNTLIYGTGLAIEVPEGYVCLLFPRSSIFKFPLSLANSVGVLDSGYRGEIKFLFNWEELKNTDKTRPYKLGERVGQMLIIPYPQVELEEVEELSETERGVGGYGSTGR